MHDLGQSGVREDAVDQIHSRGAKGHGYDEPLHQFRNFLSDQVCSEQSTGIYAKQNLDETICVPAAMAFPLLRKRYRPTRTSLAVARACDSVSPTEAICGSE
jgi:hypothetical protein